MIVFRFFYNLISFFLAGLAALIFLFYKRGRRSFFQRFGFWPTTVRASSVIWFHAASAGEVGGILPLIERLRKIVPSQKILLTCTSPTGLDQAKNYFDFKLLLPFDNYLFLDRALGRLKIEALYITETEIWPELVSYLCARGVPIYVINARVSSDFERKFKWISWLLKPSLLKITQFYCQDRLTASRLLNFGVNETQLTIVGNTKFDALASHASQQIVRTAALPVPVLVLGSLRVGEEQIWLPLIKKYADNYKFIIVPRHLEFVDRVTAALRQAEITYAVRSKYNTIDELFIDAQVVLVDTIGELMALYQKADLAFVGGTLVSGIGGHNPLEPLALGVPVLIGTYNENQQALIEDLSAEDACSFAAGAADLTKYLEAFLIDRSSFKMQAQRGKAYLEKQLGAADKLAEVIKSKIKT